MEQISSHAGYGSITAGAITNEADLALSSLCRRNIVRPVERRFRTLFQGNPVEVSVVDQSSIGFLLRLTVDERFSSDFLLDLPGNDKGT